MNLRTQISGSDLFRGIVWSPALIVSLLAILLGSAILVREGAPLLAAALTPAPKERQDESQEIARRHEESAKLARARFLKRSFFFDPPPPPPPVVERKPPPPVEIKEEKPLDLGPPPPPAKYAGPKPYGILGDMVFFASTGAIRLGEEREGVKVLAIKAPWSVTLGWQRGEYEESVWESADRHFRNALTEQDSNASGLLRTDAGNKALDGMAGSAPASIPASPAGGGRFAARAPEAPAGSRPREAPTDEESARAIEEAVAKSGEAPPGKVEPAPSQGPIHRAPYTAEEIARFDRPAAAKALQEAVRAKNDPRLDEEAKKAHQEEYDQILAHLRTLNPSGGAPK